MAKPTAGPWTVETHGSKTIIEITSVTVDGPAIVNWHGFDNSHRKHSEHMANARLIAAAPLMYEALERIMKGGWLADVPTSIQIEAQAAIDAAKVE